MAKLLIAFALIFVFGVLSGCAVTVRRYHQKPHRSLDEIIGGSVITLPDRIWIGNTIPDDMQICVEPDGLSKLHGPGCRSLGELRRWVNELQASAVHTASYQTDDLLLTALLSEQATADPAIGFWELRFGGRRGTVLLSGDRDLPLLGWLSHHRTDRISLEVRGPQ